ncbi:hypothetical protein PVK06_039900 [Gossypium arboreum]|uniref:DNA helicase Pif1-like 2B domain-containing protein n=1 Tax=Gossypium arboreum TaxID=29729 RepID=A0ABR0N426_GOSAR|nr:hypothetical protein PVK06_039900 [Gossypium arboreum]
MTNDYVEKINEKMSMFLGESKTFSSFDQVVDDTNNSYLEEFLNTLLPNGLPPHKLVLKVNCPIILLRKLDLSNSLCNGTGMVCKRFDNYVKHVEIIIGQHALKQVLFQEFHSHLQKMKDILF